MRCMVEKHKPDVILLQELKRDNAGYPSLEVEALGYRSLFVGEKSYNGVAVLAKKDMKLVRNYLYEEDTSARYIEVELEHNDQKICFISVYVPQGSELQSDKFEYKMKFMDCLHKRLAELSAAGKVVVAGGDYNIAPEDIDVFSAKKMQDSVCFALEARQKMRAIFHSGFSDSFRLMHPNRQLFSWWDYRGGGWQKNLGLRIDFILLSAAAVDMMTAAEIDVEERGADEPSDHAPVICDLGC